MVLWNSRQSTLLLSRNLCGFEERLGCLLKSQPRKGISDRFDFPLCPCSHHAHVLLDICLLRLRMICELLPLPLNTFRGGLCLASLWLLDFDDETRSVIRYRAEITARFGTSVWTTRLIRADPVPNRVSQEGQLGALAAGWTYFSAASILLPVSVSLMVRLAYLVLE